jgi:hypothetical protein
MHCACGCVWVWLWLCVCVWLCVRVAVCACVYVFVCAPQCVFLALCVYLHAYPRAWGPKDVWCVCMCLSVSCMWGVSVCEVRKCVQQSVWLILPY